MKYILGIDQSTQGTKALLFDEAGIFLGRRDLPHRQIVNELGWVSHDPEEIYRNTVHTARDLIQSSGIDPKDLAAVGISNQRETSVAWDTETGKPLCNAIVWQCSRAEEICRRNELVQAAEKIRKKTGLFLSPYFPAAKFRWILENEGKAREMMEQGRLALGTVDTWLVNRLTGGKSYLTDYSNASRTQLYNIHEKKWDEEVCELFGIRPEVLPRVQASDSCFGYTDLEGFLPGPVPIHGVLGDSHGALLGQGCVLPGMCKATYGTGSSVMMNAGEEAVESSHGLVTSLAWGLQGKVEYVLEGNINYTGAVVSWMKENLGLISSPGETESLCRQAAGEDSLYLVPAFTGLGAPYWDSEAAGLITGMTRTTGKCEIVRAGVECIAYQIADVVRTMEADASMPVKTLKVDGGATKNSYLMQFQCDILDREVQVSAMEELSAFGAAIAAGLGSGLYRGAVPGGKTGRVFLPEMDEKIRERKLEGWRRSVEKAMSH